MPTLSLHDQPSEKQESAVTGMGPSGRDPREVAALRAHRELVCRRYSTANRSQWPAAIALVAGVPVLAALLLGVLGAVTRVGTLHLVVVGAAAAIPLALGGLVVRTLWAERREHAELRSTVRALRRELPAFYAALSASMGGTHDVDDRLEPTVGFLERTGMVGVPNLVLCRLFDRSDRRYRLEGEIGGSPVAVIVVVGEPGSGTARIDTAMSRSAVGPHLFVLVPGAEHITAPAGFDVCVDGTDVTLVRSLGALPDPTALLEAVAKLGRGPVRPLPASGAVPIYDSPAAATAALVDALGASDPAGAIAAIDPQLFWKRPLVPTARAVREWAGEWRLLGARGGTVIDGPRGRFTSTTYVRFGPGPRGRRLEVQAFDEPAGVFRVVYVGEGERGVGWYDPSSEDWPHT